MFCFLIRVEPTIISEHPSALHDGWVYEGHKWLMVGALVFQIMASCRRVVFRPRAICHRPV
uniref:Uncharacterized protein n=1 Tax=Brassica oleracea var. oleracea TaxID=109376 RepID=A0A0D3BKW5_BRAOL